MDFPGKINIAFLPTQIEKLDRFTKYMDLPVELYIKRDDETGLYATGNKIRKLEYILGYALEHGYDTLVTCGGIQSNHARTTSYVATKMGLSSYLILKGEAPSFPDGNYLLDRLFGSRIEWVTEKEYEEDIDGIFDRVRRKLEKEGKRPLFIPEGASYALGVFGYIEATRELKEQFQDMNVKMDYVFSPVGSGGTLAGFLIGQRAFSLDTRMYGVNVCDDREFFQNKILDVVNQFRELYPNWRKWSSISKEDIGIIDGYVGEGYAIPYKEEIEMIKMLARTEAIILDPTYTGKAFYGMINEIKRGTIEKGSKVLFIHTGGIYGVFPQKEQFIDLR